MFNVYRNVQQALSETEVPMVRRKDAHIEFKD